MNGLYEEFKARGFTLLLINMGEDTDLVRRVVKARGYSAPVLMDTGQKVSADYFVTGSPTVYIVDRRFQITGRAIGRRDWAGEAGRRLIEALLRQ
jgi:cytochrome c biogenesis protein CcmG/thiol:disulfide interchange protein DsbE